ncbi:MAG: hypothetical protein KDJ31_14220 [Candidatus Competibacteraceae bacterium]|nr:hypothetical protein [Candidatus Competibacteraceae bacterium]
MPLVLNVHVGDPIGSLCELCGEQPHEQGGPTFNTVSSLEVKAWDAGRGDDYEVYVNGKSIDLAYTYIITAETEDRQIARHWAQTTVSHFSG